MVKDSKWCDVENKLNNLSLIISILNKKRGIKYWN